MPYSPKDGDSVATAIVYGEVQTRLPSYPQRIAVLKSFHAVQIGSLPTYFSVVSCSISYFTMKEMRNVAQKIITLLALADFFTALGYSY